MKKLFFVLIFAFPTIIFAQLEIGIRAGLNMADANLETTNGDWLEAAKINGVNVGAFANFRLGKLFAFQPEVAFSQKGFKATWNSSDSSATLNTDYLDMPMMFEAGFKVGKKFRFFANAGPNVSYLMKAEEQIYDALNGETVTLPVNFSEESIERIDVGVNFGGGFSLRVNRWKYYMTARYNMGLRELLVVEDAMDFANKAKHRVTNVSLGISYYIIGGKKAGLEIPTQTEPSETYF